MTKAAFPQPERDSGLNSRDKGMSLRDWFAGQALSGLLASPRLWESVTEEMVAKQSFHFADAMMTERDKKDTDQ